VARKEVNPHLATGEIEVIASKITIVSTAQTTPMIIADETDALEDTRMQYRYFVNTLSHHECMRENSMP